MTTPSRRLRFFLIAGVAALALGGCGANILGKRFARPPEVAECDGSKEPCLEVLVPDDTTIRPKHRGGTTAAAGAGEGFVEGKRPDEIDKTSAKDKAAALEAPSGGEKELGRTIASLGDVAQQGFWLKTPLVKTQTEGRVVWADNGNSVNVMLLPKDGDGGSQISLAAMRALGVPLTALTELIVFQK